MRITAIDIGRELSERFGYDPRIVSKITITRAGVEFTLYELNGEGQKYTENGEPVTSTVVIQDAFR